ncbi:MAG TPA: efflux RND transporter periplasmic adaptor subunit [Usitatibacter sp.]|nr:efflux RND transporter periplasmic adaptor subunit [Usitatibacter sp.]
MAVALVLAIAAVAVSWALQRTRTADAGKAAAPARPALSVTVVQPATAALALRLEATGNVAAWQEAIVGAEAPGLRISDVLVNVGDRVTKGQVLATFAPETRQAESAQQQAAVAEAQAAFDEARSNAERRRLLAASGAASKQEIEQYTTAARTAEARLAAARAAARAAEVNLGNTRVLAPDDGVVSARAATVGAVAQPGQELFRVIRKGRLEWRAEVPAADLPRVRPGQEVAVTLPGGEAAAGKVRMIAPTLDPQTRNAIVYVDLQPGAARAGMFARGEFDLGTAPALTVPQQAVVVRDGFSYVFTVTPANRVQQRKVRVGRRSGERIEIVEGLPAGTSVVAAGAGFLNDGDLVAITPEDRGQSPNPR